MSEEILIIKKKKNKFFKWKKNKVIKWIILPLVVLLLLAMCIIIIIVNSGKEDDEMEEPEIISSSSLERMVKVSDISTFETVYNGVAKVLNEKDPTQIDYYVAYDATIKAGFNFEQVKVKLNEGEKIIEVELPLIEITEVNVKYESMDFLFMNEKANASTVTETAYKRCIEDVDVESRREHAIYELARQNAENVIKALVDPFIHQLEEEYQLVITFGGVSNESDN